MPYLFFSHIKKCLVIDDNDKEEETGLKLQFSDKIKCHICLISYNKATCAWTLSATEKTFGNNYLLIKQIITYLSQFYFVLIRNVKYDILIKINCLEFIKNSS